MEEIKQKRDGEWKVGKKFNMYNKTNNMNKEFLKMQKLAGLITESEYKVTTELLGLTDLDKAATDKLDYTDEEMKRLSLDDAKELYKRVKGGFSAPHMDKLRNQLKARIEMEDSSYFKSNKK